MGSVNDALGKVKLPPMALVRQHFPEECLKDPVKDLRQELARPEIAGLIRPGMRIAITAGSRGIDCYVPLLRELVACLKALGA